MPTSFVVLDSGILLATIQNETYTEHASSLIARLDQEHMQMAAPTLLRYELVAVVRKWVYQKLISPEDAHRVLNTLLRYPIQLHFDNELLKRGSELAAEYNRPTANDSQYLALAERLSCDFWTPDERFFNALNGRFARIRWLGNLQ